MLEQKLTKYLSSALLCALIAGGFMAMAVDASAAEIRVRCESRDGDRSKASIDGNDLVAGATYTVSLSSGGNSDAVIVTADVAGEVDADWDSNAEEVGDSPIAVDFIGDSATGTITGNGTVLMDTVDCR